MPPTTTRPLAAGDPDARAAENGRRWLVLVHQLPSSPSNLRVRTWRRLQQLGAIPAKQAVYVLPDTPNTREDFEWLKAEIKAAGGDASVFAATTVDTWSEDALVEEFRRARQGDYTALAADVDELLTRVARATRKQSGRAPGARRLLDLFRQRLAAIERIDFFGSAGHDRVTAMLQQLEQRVTTAAGRGVTGSGDAPSPRAYQGRLWITRPRPGVDRMASAWLIGRFIDSQARFAFAADRETVPKDGVPFDMFGVEFSHQGDGCTFETLCAAFAIKEPAVERLAAIVHDLDLKDERFGARDAPTVAAVIEGLQLAHSDDEELLRQGMTLFDALYRTYERSARGPGPRRVARSQRMRGRPLTSRKRKPRA
jgi:hypothetical protein